MRQFLKNTSEYKKLYDALQKPGVTALFGLPPVGRALLASALFEDTGRPLCVITAGEAEAVRFSLDLEALGLRPAVFPSRDLVLRPVEGTGREYEYRRLSVLGGLLGKRVNAVCVPAEGFLQYTVPAEEFKKNTLTLKPGTEIPQKDLIEALHSAGYVRRTQVDGPGQFSVRGGIVDVYPPDRESPARMEFWGDEIDTLSAFDLLSQRRTGDLEKLYISPTREVLFGNAAETAARLRTAAEEAGRRKKAMQKAMQDDLEQLDAGLMPEDLDRFYNIRYKTPGLLTEYLDDPIFLLEEPGAIREALRAAEFRRSEELKSLLEEGLICPGMQDFYPPQSLLTQTAGNNSTLACENFARTLPDLKLKELVDIPCHLLPAWGGEVAALAEDLKPLIEQKYSVSVFAGTEKGAAALAADLLHAGFSVTSSDEEAQPGVVQVCAGHLTTGVQLPFARFAAVTGRHQNIKTGEGARKRKKNKDALSSLSDIAPGDYVVHQTHGIGVYAGIHQLELQGVRKDYLKITYAKGDVLYVPVTQLDLLSRYTAPGDEEAVKVSRLSSPEWSKAKARAKGSVQLVAKELVELYARRQQAKGFAFEPDGDWQRDFETRFEYDETDDQLTATAEIKRDMEKPCPMDRLLCGDVGVGKTEVALRAAFKCVMSGKQVAILAPTTLLAWQHYNTALSRMERFQFGIGLLSRFRTPKQQAETLRGLASGSIDVVVGTHRLLSKDVKFKDLGLVIVDEEQRFGVKHKEKLKESFIGVDMLTLSATPIPRTLNMALNGIRDMSTIEEPPIERQPIETYVMEQDDGILAEALKKELARGGQAYYLHNRVETIEACAARVGQLVPGARIGVAHGKMTEEQLSAVWKQLLDGEIDILVCTTLIETGVDVRNCNTLIVEDSDRMGLAQLYQIRGRVGRSGRKAYAYFTFKRDKVLTDVAAKRLSAIREFTSFGSGFRIAMRDLQIRGAGSLLGQSQHGQMQAVGYDLYMKLLGQALAEAKGEELQPDKSDCLIDIAVDAYIPRDYISDDAGRIAAYKRIAAVQSREDAEDVLDELIDRYGDVPECVSGLVDVSLIRITAAKLAISEIDQKKDLLSLYTENISREAFKELALAMPGRLTLGRAGRTCLGVRVKEGEKPLEVLRMVLEKLEKAE